MPSKGRNKLWILFPLNPFFLPFHLPSKPLREWYQHMLSPTFLYFLCWYAHSVLYMYCHHLLSLFQSKMGFAMVEGIMEDLTKSYDHLPTQHLSSSKYCQSPSQKLWTRQSLIIDQKWSACALHIYLGLGKFLEEWEKMINLQ